MSDEDNLIDNPTIGQEILADWLADCFGIRQKELLASGWAAP